MSMDHVNGNDPRAWAGESVVHGRLFRYSDTGVDAPLIEIREAELPRLEGYEFYEPYWVIARPPTLFAIFDRDERLIFEPTNGFAKDYSLTKLLAGEGYDSLATFRQANGLHAGDLNDMDVLVKLGLPAKVFVPSLRRKPPSS